MAKTMQVDIVGAERSLFSGTAEFLVVNAVKGQLGILPNHAPFIGRLVPGEVRVVKKDSEEESFFVSGGIIEVQPYATTVLADTVLREKELDEAQAEKSRELARQHLSSIKKKMGPDFAEAQKALAEATSQLQMIQALRKRKS